MLSSSIDPLPLIFSMKAYGGAGTSFDANASPIIADQFSADAVASGWRESTSSIAASCRAAVEFMVIWANSGFLRSSGTRVMVRKWRIRPCLFALLRDRPSTLSARSIVSLKIRLARWALALARWALALARWALVSRRDSLGATPSSGAD